MSWKIVKFSNGRFGLRKYLFDLIPLNAYYDFDHPLRDGHSKGINSPGFESECTKRPETVLNKYNYYNSELTVSLVSKAELELAAKEKENKEKEFNSWWNNCGPKPDYSSNGAYLSYVNNRDYKLKEYLKTGILPSA